MSKFYGGSLDFIQLLWAMAVTLVIWAYEELRVHSRRAWCQLDHRSLVTPPAPPFLYFVALFPGYVAL